MGEKAVLLLAAVLLLTTGFQQPKRNRAQPERTGSAAVTRVAASQSSVWIAFAPKDGGFSVMLPGKPTQKPSGDTEHGPVPSTAYYLASGKFGYMLTYMDYPYSRESLKARVEYLKMVAETGITKLGGKLVSSKPISLGEYPGREVTATFRAHFYQGRTYIANQKLYTLQVFVNGGERGSENVSKFFESFEVLPDKQGSADSQS